MARRLLRDECEMAARILDGEFDADLEFIVQAAQHRKKQMYRKGTIVNVVAGDLKGKVGVVLKVNPTRISVGIGSPVVEGEGSPWSYTTYDGGEWNIPPRMLEVA